MNFLLIPTLHKEHDHSRNNKRWAQRGLWWPTQDKQVLAASPLSLGYPLGQHHWEKEGGWLSAVWRQEPHFSAENHYSHPKASVV